MSVHLLVSERDQRQDSLVRLFLFRRWRMRRAGNFPGRGHANFILQLENDSLGRFFAEPAYFGERSGIRRHDRSFEIVHAHSAQDGKSQLWPDAADIVDQQAKEIAFRGSHESKEDMRIFANVQVSQDMDRLSHTRQLVVARNGMETS